MHGQSSIKFPVFSLDERNDHIAMLAYMDNKGSTLRTSLVPAVCFRPQVPHCWSTLVSLSKCVTVQTQKCQTIILKHFK